MLNFLVTNSLFSRNDLKVSSFTLLLTGASQPVAQAYAEELARRGVSIIFVAQEHSSLVRDAAASLSQNYGVETVVVLADFCLDQAACKPIKDTIRDKDVGFLVNCLDESLLLPHDVAVMPEQGALDAVRRNVTAVTLMARLVLPGMLERSRGAVVNISSAACRRALPGRALLAASAVREHENSGGVSGSTFSSHSFHSTQINSTKIKTRAHFYHVQ